VNKGYQAPFSSSKAWVFSLLPSLTEREPSAPRS